MQLLEPHEIEDIAKKLTINRCIFPQGYSCEFVWFSKSRSYFRPKDCRFSHPFSDQASGRNYVIITY